MGATVKTVMQVIGLGSAVVGAGLGLWQGAAWQCDVLTLLAMISAAAQLTAMRVSGKASEATS